MSITATALAKVGILKDGSYGKNVEVLQHVLFDTQDFAATTMRPLTTYFNNPIGATYMAGTKKKTETNLQTPSQLPNGQAFLVDAVSIAGIAIMAGADVDQNVILQAYFNILQASLIELKIANKEFDLQIPGSMFLNTFQAASLNTAANGAAIGEFFSTGKVKVAETPVPIGTIAQPATFNLNMYTEVASATNLAIINTASTALNTQLAQLQFRLHGTLVRRK